MVKSWARVLSRGRKEIRLDISEVLLARFAGGLDHERKKELEGSLGLWLYN